MTAESFDEGSLWECVVFSVGDRSVTVAEVMQAALFWGCIEPAWGECMRGVACVARAEQEEWEPDEDALQALSEQFRYGRELITVEETEAWLAKRRLDRDDFDRYLIRAYWRENAADEVPPDKKDYLGAGEELQALFCVDLLMSGELDRLARKLSWRFAALQASEKEADPAPETLATERTHFLERTGLAPEALRAWLAAAQADPAWLEASLRREAAYSRLCLAALAPERLTRALLATRLELSRLDLETVELDSLDAAREAFLCVREDGLSMEETAREGGYPYSRKALLLEDLSEEWQQRLSQAAEGGTLEPIASGEIYYLCRLLQRTAPSLADAEVKHRLENRLLENYFGDLTARSIRWQF